MRKNRHPVIGIGECHQSKKGNEMKNTISAKDAVVWHSFSNDTVMVWPRDRGIPEDTADHVWCDPIGANYRDWQTATDKQRMQLMLETAIDLAMQGVSLKSILIEFSRVREFYAMGQVSFPMCRALTSALLGECLEPNTKSYDELFSADFDVDDLYPRVVREQQDGSQ